MADRIYIATPTVANTTAGQPKRLIKAASQAQGYAHLARATWTMEAASAMDVAEAMAAGARLETAGQAPCDRQEESPV